MAVMLESPSYDNSALGDGSCKSCPSCFADSMELSAYDGKGMVKYAGKFNSVCCAAVGCVICKNFKTSIVVKIMT